MSDSYVLENSKFQRSNKDPSPFNERSVLRIPDSNFNNYTSSQVQWNNLSQLSTLDSFASLKEFTLEIPYTVSVTSTAAMGTTASNVYALGLKGYLNLVNSLSVEIDNQPVVDITNLLHIPANFRLLSTMSQDNVANSGASMGFVGVETNNIMYNDVLGEQNQYSAVASSNATAGKRMVQTNYNLASTQGVKFADRSNVVKTKRSFYDGISTQSLNYHFMALIKLSDLSDFFENAPLIKGLYMKLSLNLHTAKSVLTVSAGGAIAGMVNTSAFGHNPVLLSTLGATTGFMVPAAANVITVTTTICHPQGVNTSCVLNAIMYKMTTETETQFASLNTHRLIPYSKYAYKLVSGVNAGAEFNELVNPSLNMLRYMLIVPVLSARVNTLATPATAQGNGSSTLISPLTTAGNTTMLNSSITQFNVDINGVQLYKQNKDYNHDMFLNEVLGSNSVNGAMEYGFSSGLINFDDYNNHMGFVYVDLSRKASFASDVMPSQISIRGVNNTLASVDYHVFICSAVSKTIDIVSGKIVT